MLDLIDSKDVLATVKIFTENRAYLRDVEHRELPVRLMMQKMPRLCPFCLIHQYQTALMSATPRSCPAYLT